jgi:phage terminase small subunit
MTEQDETAVAVAGAVEGHEEAPSAVGADGLTWRQRRFAKEYAKDFDGSAACRRAGYQGIPGTLGTKAYELLRHPGVKRAVSRACVAIEATVQVKAEQVVGELVRLAMADIREIFDEEGRLVHPREWTDQMASAVSSVEFITREVGQGEVEHVAKVKLWDKPKALELLANHLRLLRSTVEHVNVQERVFESDEQLQMRILALAMDVDAGTRAKVRALLEARETN